MASNKTDRLKKLEYELDDLIRWKKLSLVPKNDTDKHDLEISAVQQRIKDEKERIMYLKESGSLTEFSAPQRKGQNRSAYPENASLSDINIEPTSGLTDAGLDMDTEPMDVENSIIEENNDDEEVTTEDDDAFSEKNRWKRGIIDPDVDDW